ncbi:uncharacterized protein LOC126378420 [Pectinophora gossypiella]|uniref:uncharacterized protein LOC126368187 n=1 Tax=Pectinophora gossypiella TaxID=13191 RepID=UPI00214EA163|nr:uncharacterized protein LOC126368187 [Pectinophora gossypiella]XP_049882729.1 uncharacterized protein LOC126378420 [Pectinophora gossypiella]
MSWRAKEETVQRWIESYPELMYESTNHTIYCTKCETNIGCRKSTIKRHVEGVVHKGTPSMSPNDFLFDFIEFLILCNIPWAQVENPSFKNFFQKYMCCACSNRKKLPSESILRKKYLDEIYAKKLATIHSEIVDEKIWISLDETTDFLGRYVVHFLVKPLNSTASKKVYLIACKVLENINGKTISQFVIDCLKNLWGDSYEDKVESVLLLCTDSVAYMLTAGRVLKQHFPNMKHVTCLAHALHRVAEKIRSEYPDVDTLIANGKKFFLKSPSRVKLLKDMYPNLPLPPQPIITRWGTWLAAASYYVKYFDEIKHILTCLRSSEAVSIKNAKNIINKDNIRNDLNFIDENFKIIQIALTNLQKRDRSIVESFQIFDEVRSVVNWSMSSPIQNKLEAVISRNPDIDIIRTFSEQIASGSATDDILIWKFAPLTSVEVERTFSTYKWILNVKRNRLKLANMEKIIVIYFNSTENENAISNVEEIDSENEDDD